jgi:hypothetical protein
MSSHQNFKFPTHGSKVVNPTRSIGTLGPGGDYLSRNFFRKKIFKNKSADQFSRIVWSTQILSGPACLTQPNRHLRSNFITADFHPHQWNKAVMIIIVYTIIIMSKTSQAWKIVSILVHMVDFRGGGKPKIGAGGLKFPSDSKVFLEDFETHFCQIHC